MDVCGSLPNENGYHGLLIGLEARFFGNRQPRALVLAMLLGLKHAVHSHHGATRKDIPSTGFGPDLRVLPRFGKEQNLHLPKLPWDWSAFGGVAVGTMFLPLHSFSNMVTMSTVGRISISRWRHNATEVETNSVNDGSRSREIIHRFVASSIWGPP